MSPLCPFYSRDLQHQVPTVTVCTTLKQVNAFRMVKLFGPNICYICPAAGNEYSLSVLVFWDSSRSVDHGQLRYISGLLFGYMRKDTLFHIISSFSHNCKALVKSIGASEILSGPETIDEVKTLSKAISSLLVINSSIQISLDIKDLSTHLLMQRNSIGRSIGADVKYIRYEIGTQNVNTITWFSGTTNDADPSTKTGIPVTPCLQLLLSSGVVPMDFSNRKPRWYQRFLG